MSWGGLNPALTQFRRAIVVRFPKRGTQSDGGYADAAHGSSSQHQPDSDGSVDAFDCDVNFQGSTTPTGTKVEKRIKAAVIADFLADPRALLVISDRKIMNNDINDGAPRDYTGDNPHDKHAHCQTRQALERQGHAWPMPRTDALLRELNGDDVEPAVLLDYIGKALENERGQAAIAKAAGKGVHDQKIGRSDETIGQDLQADDLPQLLPRLEALEAAQAANAETLARILGAVTTPADPLPADPPAPTPATAAKTTTTKSR